MSKLRVHSLNLAQQPGSRLRVHSVSLAQVVAVAPDAGDDVTAESRAAVTLTATIGGSVSAWSWTQTAGPAVSLSGSGATRSFTAPALLAGAVLEFAVTATIGGVVSPPGAVAVTVLPHQWWVLDGGVWTPLAAPALVT